ncbi:MAG: hypothetical protein KAU60_11670 [Desulfobacterales bacterium]|jgi:hypothetical protein|nr:hypothetical protein [Desulfobacterales bacterium]
MAHKIGNKKINLAMQLVHLKKLFPESTASIYRNCLTWKGEVKPTPLSETYAVQLRYTLAKSPQIKVLKPELIPPEGKCLPHTYHGKRLCLYYPGIGDWRLARRLAVFKNHSPLDFRVAPALRNLACYGKMVRRRITSIKETESERSSRQESLSLGI